jgi:hypothetical protein
MGQVTIYLDKRTEQRMRRAVELSGKSASSWVADLIRRQTAERWPEDVAALAGAWPDLPEAEELRRNQGTDAAREPL